MGASRVDYPLAVFTPMPTAVPAQVPPGRVVTMSTVIGPDSPLRQQGLGVRGSGFTGEHSMADAPAVSYGLGVDDSYAVRSYPLVTP